MKLIEIAIDRITPVKAQPAARTTMKAIKGLYDVVLQTGFIVPPLAVENPDNRGYFIAPDGNRRLAVAKKLGRTSIKCNVIEEGDVNVPLRKLFALLNSGVLRPRGSDYAQSWANDGDYQLKVMPKSQSSYIRDLIRIFGREETRDRCSTGAFGPSIVRQIEALHSWLQEYPKYRRPVKSVGRWVIDHKMSSVVYTSQRAAAQGLIKREAMARTFARLIDEDRKFEDRKRA